MVVDRDEMDAQEIMLKNRLDIKLREFPKEVIQKLLKKTDSYIESKKHRIKRYWIAFEIPYIHIYTNDIKTKRGLIIGFVELHRVENGGFMVQKGRYDNLLIGKIKNGEIVISASKFGVVNYPRLKAEASD